MAWQTKCFLAFIAGFQTCALLVLIWEKTA